ncbi:MAG: hypothetical protein NC350_03825 [Corallococcus sp.]|nr:hypothetical protein [Corallococcus sp.]
MNFVTVIGGIYGATDASGIEMNLCYVITYRRVGANFVFEPYVFGANGYQADADRSFEVKEYYSFADFAEGNAYKLTYEEDTVNYPGLIPTILAANTKITIRFYTDSDLKQQVADDNMANGLPWKKGTYYMHVSVTFDEAYNLNEFARTIEFEVSPRIAKVEWDSKPEDLTKVYNGANQTRAAHITNMPMRTAGDTTAAPQLTTTLVKDVKYSGGSVVAHTIYATLQATVNGAENVGADNFTLEGATNLESEFTVTPKPIAVTGTDVPSHVYGDAVTEKAYTVNDGYAFCETGVEYIEVVILTSAAGQPDAFANNLTGVGSYRVVPRLKNIHGNYTLEFEGASLVTEGVYTIVKRQVTVTVLTDGDGVTLAASVYGASLVDLNGTANPIYQVTATNGVNKDVAGAGIPQGKTAADIFTLGCTVTQYSAVSSDTVRYPVTCTFNDEDNYTVTFDTDAYEYLLTKAKLTIESAAGYNGTYDASAHDAFAVSASSVNGMEITWWYFDGADSQWKVYQAGAGEAQLKVRNVTDSASYKLKVTAPNHEDLVYAEQDGTEKEVQVTVSKATLTVSVNLTIKFAESGPDKHGTESGKWYMQSLDALTSATDSIFSVQGFVGTDGGAAEKTLFESGEFYNLTDSGFAYKYKDGVTYNAGDAVDTYALVMVTGANNEITGLTCDNYKFVGAEGMLKVDRLSVKVTVNGGDDYTSVYGTEGLAVLTVANDVTAVETDEVSVYDGAPIDLTSFDFAKFVSAITTDALVNKAGSVVTNNVTADGYPVIVTLTDDCKWQTTAPQNVYKITRAQNVITTENYTLFKTASASNVSMPVAAAWTYGDWSATHQLGYAPTGNHALTALQLLCRDNDLKVTLHRAGVVAPITEITITSEQDATDELTAMFAAVHAASGEYSFYAGEYTLTYHMDIATNYDEFNENWYFVVQRQQLSVTPVGFEVRYGDELSLKKNLTSVAEYDADGDYPYNAEGLVSNNGVTDELANIVTFTFASTYAAGFENGSVKQNGYEICATAIDALDAADIVYDNGTFAYQTANYDITFGSAVFQVTARAISVKIVPRSNHFDLINLVGDSYVIPEEVLPYSFTLTSGTFAEGDGEAATGDTVEASVQNVFVLTSKAFDSFEGAKTNKRGEYPIYLTAGSKYGKDGLANYAITVEAPDYTNVTEADAISRYAGKYTIERAELNVLIEDNPYMDEDCNTPYTKNPYEYDGNPKYFKYTSNLPAGVAEVKGQLVYYPVSGGIKGNALSYVPKDFGSYRVEFVVDPEADNYSTSKAFKNYSIEKRSIEVNTRQVENSNGSAIYENGAYYFNGGNFTYPVSFSHFADGESINLSYRVSNRTLHKAIGTTDKAAFMWCNFDLTDNRFEFEVRNAGIYEVTITLADSEDNDNPFKASNYEFVSGATTRTFTLNIALETLTVETASTTVQYGSPLTDTTRFGGFTPLYSVRGVSATNATNTTVNTLLHAEEKNNYLKLADGKTAVEYTSDYVVGDSEFGSTYNLALNSSCIVAYNFNVVPANTDGKLSVIARNIDITVKGYADFGAADKGLASCKYDGTTGHNVCIQNTLATYANRAKFLSADMGANFTRPSDYQDPILDVKLAIASSARNVGTRYLGPQQTGAEMYAVTFKNSDGEEIRYEYLEDVVNIAKLPTYEILPETLYIAVGQYGANVSYNNLVRNFGIPYGTNAQYNTSSNSTFAIRYSGWVNSDEGSDTGHNSASVLVNVVITKCKITKVGDDSRKYAPWESHAGEKYTVEPVLTGDDGRTLTYANYTIVTEPATVTVEQLAISGITVPVEYKEMTTTSGGSEVINYNNGISGIKRDINISYTYGANLPLPKEASEVLYQSIRYNTKSDDTDTAGNAPTKAGEYVATVTLASNGDYKFDCGKSTYVDEFTHIVTKRTIRLAWKEPSVVFETSSVNNVIATYRKSLMTIVAFNHGGTNIIGNPTYTYTDTDEGLTLEVGALGRFEITLEFNADAARNYSWSDGDGRRVIWFTADSSNNSVKFSVEIDDTVYRGTMPAPRITLTNYWNTPIENPSINYMYAKATGIDVTGDRHLTSAQVSNLTFMSNAQTDAGWYVIQANYVGNANYAAAQAYYLYNIAKQTVYKPTFTTTDTVYNGGTLSADIGYDTRDVYISNFAYDFATTSTGATVRVTDVGAYKITLALRDKDNLVWDDSLKTDSDTVLDDDGEIESIALTWTIAKANNNKIIWNPSNIYEVFYGENFLIEAGATYSNAVAIYFAEKTEIDKEDITDWTDQGPSDAKTYYVKVVSVDNGNYNEAVDYCELDIKKATLYATATGTLTYGQLFDDGNFNYVLKNSDGAVVNALVTVDPNLLEYLLADGTSSEGQLLEAKSHALKLGVDSETGYVKGLTSANYNILLADKYGSLVVSPKEITVQIGNYTGVYHDTIVDLNSAITLEVVGENDIDEKTLGVDLRTSANESSNVNRYDIYAADWSNKNYAVTFRNGTYTITELRVTVEIQSVGGTYGGKIEGVKVTAITTVNAAVNRDLGADALKFTYRYTGKSNGGVTYNSADIPTLAGTYIATVTGIVGNTNYILDLTAGDVSAPFVISKEVIDAGKLTVPSKAYTGEAIVPQIIDNDYNLDGEELIYRVAPHDDFVARGTHYLTLRLIDFDNYKWQSLDIRDMEVAFVITKAENSLLSPIEISGWTYGGYNAKLNVPTAEVKFGTIVFEYSAFADGGFTTRIPENDNAGTYYVRATVQESDDYGYFESKPVEFRISPIALTAPTLDINGTNNTYTGEQLAASLVGFDDDTMSTRYYGSSTTLGSDVTVYATYAGDYQVVIMLRNTTNYTWAQGTTLNQDNNAVINWHINRQKVAMPEHDNKQFVVNGSLITYLPEGFDDTVMAIENNTSGYGGTFTATVSLKDTDNYEWEDGTTDPLADYGWSIVGAHTVFIAVTCSLAGVSAAAIATAIVQFVMLRKKKHAAQTFDGQSDETDEEDNAEEVGE